MCRNYENRENGTSTDPTNGSRIIGEGDICARQSVAERRISRGIAEGVRVRSSKIHGRGGWVGNLATSEVRARPEERKPPLSFTWANLRVECG